MENDKEKDIFNKDANNVTKKVLMIDEDIVSNPIIENNDNSDINQDNIDLDSILVSKDSVIDNSINKENGINKESNINIDNKLENNKVVEEQQEIKIDNNIKERKSFIIGTKLGYVLGVFILVIALFGSTYAFFNYNKEDSRQADIMAGEVYVRVTENNLNLSLTKQYPRTTAQARSRNDNYIDFHLVGKNTSLTKVVGYKFTLVNGDDVSGKTRINPDYVLFDLAVLDNNDNETLLLSAVKQSDFNNASISGFYIPTETNSEIQRKYRIRAWISEEVSISDDEEENATYTQSQYGNLFANFKVNVNSQDREFNLGNKLVRKAINDKINAPTNSCNPIWVDDMDTPNDDTDDITYFSGTNDCVDMNYVWYSGKLWRITAIYPDGTMKLITENNITTIAINEMSGPVDFYTDENTTSYIYQWLNEDFYDTLYNVSSIMNTSKLWNVTNSNASSTTEASTRLLETTMILSNVGLLNSYEYYNSYRCVESETCNGSSYSTGYLNISYLWWLLNPYDSSKIWYVGKNGSISSTLPYASYGVRPVIYLKNDVEFIGNGTKTIPYQIVGDKEKGKANELLNTRMSGEYVKLKNGDNEQKYRIIGVEDNKTKIIAMDYAANGIQKLFSTSGLSYSPWGAGITTGNNTWYTYLNSTYYPDLISAYGDMFDSGTYYYALMNLQYNYKLSVCASTTNESIKTCIVTSSKGVYDIGLPRYGEIFSAQQNGGFSNSSTMWLVNQKSLTEGWQITANGLGKGEVQNSSSAARPTVHLKSTVKIISGSGTEDDPYVVGLGESSSQGQIASCPGCKYIYPTNEMYTAWNTVNQTPTVLTTGLYNSYQDVITSSGKNYFFGVNLNSNNQVTDIYSCGVKGSVPFCIKGTSDGIKYNDNKSILQSVNLWNNTCSVVTENAGTSSEYEYTSCSYYVGALATSFGSVFTGIGEGEGCYAYDSGNFECVG